MMPGQCLPQPQRQVVVRLPRSKIGYRVRREPGRDRPARTLEAHVNTRTIAIAALVIVVIVVLILVL